MIYDSTRHTVRLFRLADERLNDVLVRASAVTPFTVADLVLGQLPVKEVLGAGMGLT